MKIAYITAGAADMYCGSCMHDNTLATALIAKGHDCLLIPTYTPLRTDEKDVSLRRIFFGGISVYLEQKISLFRHMPPFLDRLLSMPGLLRWAGRFAVNTRAEDLGGLTVSMLKGIEGYQRREVNKLVGWLARDVQPQVVNLTNALLSGMTLELKRRLGAPVLCTLQGEDLFLESLPEPYKQQALALVRENCRHIAGFLTTSRYYADFMAAYLDIPRERIDVVYPGINLSGYDDGRSAGSDPEEERPAKKEDSLSIGYLARISPEKGLHILVDAFERLQRMPGAGSCRLRVAGYLGARDRPYLESLRQRAEQQGWGDRFDHVGEVDYAGKINFLRSLDILSVPTTYREPKGLYVLEAWASGVPVVQPRHGSFPELIEATGGGLLVNPEDSADLAHALHVLLQDAEQRRRLGGLGRDAVRRQFHAGRMAAETLEIFERHVRSG